MDAPIGTDAELQTLIDAALRGELSDAQAERLARVDASLMKAVLLAAVKYIAEQNRRIADLQSKLGGAAPIPPSMPSGQRPVYTKPATPKRRRKPGAKNGHQGTRRPTPERIDRRESHRLPRCPDCGGRLQRCRRTRTRIVEDIPEEIESVVTEHALHRDYCPQCKKHVEPVVPDALPGAALGHRVFGLTSWFHYGLGVTIDQVVQILSCHLRTRITPGGLVQGWHRLAEILAAWYEQIAAEAKGSTHLHADETGWRVSGQTHWLWCFANAHVCYYMIDRSRGSPALQRFFTEAFEGVLIHDFWAAYGRVEVADRQYCLVHLLRELETVDQRNDSRQWRAFAKRTRRLVRDGVRLRSRADFAPGRYQNRVDRLNQRLCALANEAYTDADARRLAERLRRHGDHIFCFLDYADVAWENNFAERQIRPAVIMRKNSQSNRSERGAATQAILMSVYRTLKLRGHHPIDVITEALRTYVTTGKLPAMPGPVADG